MTEHESGEALLPPKKSSYELVAELAERWAIDVQNDNSDHLQLLSTYPLSANSLGLLSIGKPDVAFEKFIDHHDEDPASAVTYTVFIGDGYDNILVITATEGKLTGGFGETALNCEDELDPEELHPLFAKLAVEMWLLEMGLSSDELDSQTITSALKTVVNSLARTPACADDPNGDKLDYYHTSSTNQPWTSLKAEQSWFSQEHRLLRLALMDGDTEIIDLCVDSETGDLLVTNHSGKEFADQQAIDRARMVFRTVAEVVTR